MPKAGKDTGQALPMALGSFSLPRGLPPFDSVFEGQQPSYTPGSHLCPPFKDCGGNWQNTASSVHAVEDKDVPGTHLSDECARMCEAVVVNVCMTGVWPFLGTKCPFYFALEQLP